MQYKVRSSLSRSNHPQIVTTTPITAIIFGFEQKKIAPARVSDSKFGQDGRHSR